MALASALVVSSPMIAIPSTVTSFRSSARDREGMDKRMIKAIEVIKRKKLLGVVKLTD
ncbi:MAG: hypothetical protein HZA00_01730 [Nitrospinae bacterium]|nr:hypothetical protein [Nitrospinota bacterium]